MQVVTTTATKEVMRSPTSICLSTACSQKLLIKSLWKFFEWLDITMANSLDQA